MRALLILIFLHHSTPTPRAVVTFFRPGLLNASAIPDNVTVVKQYGRRLVVHLGRDIDETDTDWLASELGGDGVVQLVEPDMLVGYGDIDSPVFTADQVFEADAAMPWNLDENEPFSLHTATLPTLANTTVASLDSGLAQAGVDRWSPVGGFDFISSPDYSNDQTGRDGNYIDPGDNGPTCTKPSWHGTRTVSVIKQIAPSCSLLILRVLGRCGSGFANDVTDAIVWSAGGTINGIASNPTPAKVITMSLAGPGACPSYLQSAVNQALGLGALLVSAAGNQGKDASGYFPGNCAGVFSIGASTRQGTIATYSNFGTTIAFNAPGGDTANPIYTLSILNGILTPYYSTGTSFAAPHVAGFAALTYTTSWRANSRFMDIKVDNIGWNNIWIGKIPQAPVQASDQYLWEWFTNCDAGKVFDYQSRTCVLSPAGRITRYGAANAYISWINGPGVVASSCHSSCSIGFVDARENGAWCTASGTEYNEAYIIYPLWEVETIIGSITKGRKGTDQWVYYYDLYYWTGSSWSRITQNSFAGNTDADSPTVNMFPGVSTSMVMLVPTVNHGWTSLRWTLLSDSNYGTLCGRGTFSAAGASVCTTCPIGSYSMASQNAVCLQCQAGAFVLPSGSGFPMEFTYDNQCGTRWVYEQMCNTPYPAYKCENTNRWLWKHDYNMWWVTELGQCSPYNGWSGPNAGSDPMAALMTVASNVRYCARCPTGTWSGTLGSSTCNSCSAGTASSILGATGCGVCPVGTYAGPQSTMCLQCSPGTFSGSAQSTACSSCTPGTYASGSGLSSCTSCQAGTYNQAASAQFPMELSYINQCGSRWVYEQMCSTPYPAYKCADANRFLWKSGDWWWVTESGQCSPNNGWYGPSPGSDPVAALVAVSSNVNYCSSCPPGTWSATISANSATVCQLCAAGTRSTVVGAVSINTCQTCAAGSWSAAGSSVCTQCVAGSWSSTPSANSEAACQSCAAGTWSASVGANSVSVCVACATGSYSTTPKATSSSVCIKCGLGYFSSTPKASSIATCVECAAGSFNNDLLGRTSCILCSIGTYSEFKKTGWDGNGCRTCQGGTYASAQGQIICNDRTIGRTCPFGTQYVEYDRTHDSFCDPCIVVPNCKPMSSKCLSDSSDTGLPVGTPLCMCAGGLEMVSKSCQPCQPGFFRPDLDPSNKCTAWTVQNCGSGKFPIDGSLTTDTSCLSCPSPPPSTVFSGQGCAWECILGFE